MIDDKITNLPIKFKAPPTDEGPMLQIVQSWSQSEGCNHRWAVHNHKTVNAKYLIREGETEVECSLCNTKLDPMFVLRQLANKESEWHRTREAYQAEMVRLNERKLTKCQHCSKMTRISRR